MNPDLLNILVQSGFAGVLIVVLAYAGKLLFAYLKAQEQRFERQDSRSRENAEFIQRLVEQAAIEREKHLMAWTELTNSSIKVQQEYTSMLEQYTKAFGILEDTMQGGIIDLRKEHEQIMRGLDKRGLGNDRN